MMRFAIGLIITLSTFSFGITAAWIFTPKPYVVPVFVPQATEILTLTRGFNDPTALSEQIPPPPPAASEFVFDYDPAKFSPRGDYYLLGRKPKNFQELEYIEIAVYDNEGSVGFGTIDTDGSENPYYTVTSRATNKTLTFTALPISEDDYEYRFDGRFLKTGILSKVGRNQAVLKGKFFKLKNGVKIAECEVKFRVQYLGC